MSRKKTHKFVFFEFANNINHLINDKFSGDKYSAADQLGVSYETIRRWCNGDNLPDGAQLLTIKDQWGVSIDWLLGVPTIESPGLSHYSEDIQNLCSDVIKILKSGIDRLTIPLRMYISASIKMLEQEEEITRLRLELEDMRNKIHLLPPTPGKRSTGTG